MQRLAAALESECAALASANEAPRALADLARDFALHRDDASRYMLAGYLKALCDAGRLGRFTRDARGWVDDLLATPAA